jgi:hypothetical protein
MEWFAGGGWVMYLLLAVGGLTLFAAYRFALHPDPTQLARIASLQCAVAWTTILGVCADLAAVGFHINANPTWAHSPDLALFVLQGVAESLSPAMLGAGLLGISHMLLAAGHARLRAQGVYP